MVIDRRLIAAVCALPFLACPRTPSSAAAERQPMCAIDMDSNTFRRIVASFEDGRYVQTNIEKRTLTERELGTGLIIEAHTAR